MFVQLIALASAAVAVNAQAITLPLEQVATNFGGPGSHNRIFETLASLGEEFQVLEEDATGEHIVRDAATPAVINLTNLRNGLSYLVNIKVGTPGQPFLMTLDTGSNQLWVPSATCGATGNCANLNYYESSRSSSYIPTSNAIATNITYGKGFVKGYTATDVVTMGPYVAQNHPILVVSSEDATLLKQLKGTSDGVLGLAYLNGGNLNSTNAGVKIPTIFNSFFAQKQFTEPVFSIYLGPLSAQSTFTLGGVDASRVNASAVVYFPVTSHPVLSYYWTLESVSLGTDSKTFSAPPQTSAVYAVIDSGSSFLIVDSTTFKSNVLPALQSSGARVEFDAPTNITVVECADISKLPTFTFAFVDEKGTTQKYGLQGKDYVIQVTVEGATGCVVGFSPTATIRKDGSVMWILGDVFLRKVVSVFDFGKGRVGFATVDGSTVTTKSGAVGGIVKGMAVLVTMLVLVI